MTKVYSKVNRELVEILSGGGVGVIPTDTVYGLVGSALEKRAVQRIYRLKKRGRGKPFIVLVSSIGDLKKFGVDAGDKRLVRFLNSVWPGPVSVILPVGKKSIAFRLPKPFWLRNLIKKTGPLVAPSANIHGRSPAKNITEAKKFFGDRVDFYLNKKTAGKSPSVILKVLRF